MGGGIEKRAAVSGRLEKDLKTTSLKAVWSKAAALTSTALTLVLSAVATPALANTVNGAPAPAYTIKLGATVGTYNVTVDTDDVGGPGSVGIAPVITPTSRVDSAAIEITNAGFNTVTVNSGRLVGAHNTYAGIWINRGESLEAPYTGVVPATATIVNNGMIQGSQFGIDISGLCGANCTSAQMKSVAISGTGRVFGTTAMNLRGDTVGVNGQSLILGWNTGLDIVGTTVNIGTSARLGEVVAGTGPAIRVTANAINLVASRISSGLTTGAAVQLISNASGITSVDLNGQLTALGDGIEIARAIGFSGITIAASGRVTANGTGIRSVSTGAASTTVTNWGVIQSGGTGVWLSNPQTGNLALAYYGTGSITAGGTGIRMTAGGQATVGYWFTPSSPRQIGTSWRPIGTINAGAYGIHLEQPIAQTTNAFVRLSPSWVSAGIGVFSDRLTADMVIELEGGISGTTSAIFMTNYLGTFSLLGRGTATIGGGLDAVNIQSGQPGQIQQANFDQVASFTAVSGSAIRLSGVFITYLTDIGPIIAGMSGIDISGITTSVVMRSIATIVASGGDGISVNGAASVSAASLGPIVAGRNGIVVSGRGSFWLQGLGTILAGVRGIDLVNVASVSIGGGSPIGPITGGTDGIRIVIAQGGDATYFSLGVTQNITGTTGWGVTMAGATSGSVVVQSGTISGAVGGMSLSATNTASLIVAGPGRIEGATGLVFTQLPTRFNVVGTITNFGTIQTTAAAGPEAGIALATNGQIAVNNSGIVVGRITHNAQLGAISSSLGFYNKLGGFWVPGVGTSTFQGSADVLGNEGTINLPVGTTRLEGLELLANNAGGVISFLGSGFATDELVLIGALRLDGNGGRIRVNFDADAALGTLDRGTSGNADTIVASSVSPSGVTLIDIVATGGSNGAGAPVPLTGSVAIVASGTAMAAPAPGATLTPAANYAFGTGNPSTAARTFGLVSDGAGGVFLQWVPVTSGGTVGGFSGGALGAADSAGAGVGGSLGFLQASLAGASQAAVQVADMTSFGAAFGGTGAAGAGCGSANGAAFSVRTGEWAGTGRRSASGSSAQGRDLAFSPGAGANSCGRVSVGAFQFGGTAAVGLQAQRGTDAARGNSQGAGGYVRADSGTGFFAQLTGAAGSQRARVRNGIFGTEATVDTTLGLVDITAGYATPISDSVAIETRVSATRLSSAANPFRDSLGYEVTRLDTRADSLTATAGLIARTDSGGQGFVRAGIRTTDARQDGLAYGIRTLSQDSGTGSVLEAGWNQPLGDEASVEFALSSDSGGPLERQEARVQLSLGW